MIPLVFLCGCQQHDKAVVDGGPVQTDATPDTGPTCPADSGAQFSTAGPLRRTVPWMVTTPRAGDPGDGGAPADASIQSGCAFSIGTAPIDVSCSGEAVVVNMGNVFAFVMGDGSVISHYDPQPAPDVGAPALADGATAWVQFSRHTSVVCPVCGSYQTTQLQVRAAADGPLLWVGFEGPALGVVDPDLVREIFGVGAHPQLVCEQSFVAGCHDVVRKRYQHVLETTPEHVVPATGPDSVPTPNGAFNVIWSETSEVSTLEMNCFDGPAVASDNGFAASRTAPPSLP